MLFQAFTIICSIAALVPISQSAPEPLPDLVSPCPEFFTYKTLDKPDRWTGNLLVRYEEDLHGLWIRLIFDRDIKEVIVDGFETKLMDENRKEVLVKNRDQLLKASAPVTLKITVLYEGSRLPQLKEYRLNARTVCPDPKTLRTDFFKGDTESSDFLTTIQANSKPNTPALGYECGTETDPTKPRYPWRATISVKNTEAACEAILVSPSYLLAPAHCVTFRNGYTVVPSEFLSVHLGQGLRLQVSKVIVKRGYEAEGLEDDLALLKLVAPLEVSNDIRPICLEGGNKFDRALLIGKDIKEGKIGSEVVEAGAARITREECELLRPQLKGVLDEKSYCVSYKSDNKNCVGTSGNGFVSVKDGKSTLRGVVTLGVLLQNEKECKQNSVIVVADIGRYLNWIQRVIY